MDENRMYVAPDGRHASIEIIVGVNARNGFGQYGMNIRLEEIQDRLGQKLDRIRWAVEGVVELDEVAIMERGIELTYPIVAGDKSFSSAAEFHAAIARTTENYIGRIVHDSTGRAFSLQPWVAVYHPRLAGDNESTDWGQHETPRHLE
jgi:hypothetical protein